MRTHLWKAVLTGTLITVSAAACSDDGPFDEGVGEVEQLQFDRGFASVGPGDTITFSVAPRDQFGNPLEQTVDFEACDDGRVTIGDVRPDSAELFPRTLVDVIGSETLGYTCIVASAGGVEDSVRVLVVPPYLLTDVDATVSGDTIVFIRSLGQPAFDGDVSVSFTTRTLPAVTHTGFPIRGMTTPDSLYVVAPINLPVGTYDVEIGNIGTAQSVIPSTLEITDQGEYEDGMDSGTATRASWPRTTVPFELVGVVDSLDSNDWVAIDLAAPATVTCDANWDRENFGSEVMVFAFYTDALVFIDYVYAFPPDPTDVSITLDLPAGETNLRIWNYTPASATTYWIDCYVDEG